MKIQRFWLYGLLFICWMTTLVFQPILVKAEEEKSELISKTIQATQDIPYLPDHYRYIDWRQRAVEFNNFLFKTNTADIIFNQEEKNTGRAALGIKTYLDEGMEEPSQALTLIGALLSTEALDLNILNEEEISKLMESIESYYNIENGEGTFLNYQEGNSKEMSFWQQLYPSIVYFMLMDRYSPTVDSDAMLQNIADTWYEVVMDLGGSDGIVDFGYTGYDFKNKIPFDNGKWIEPDAAAGVALLQYYAFEKFGNRKYMKAANLCMEYMDDFDRNPGYELLYLYLPYLSARLNSTGDYHFNTAKYMEFFFTESDYRREYGIFNDDYATGLIGERTQYGGSPSSFQSIIGATALVPMLKYDQRYAIEVGRYLLNVTNNLNLFYDEDSSDNANIVPLERVEKDGDARQRHSILSGTYLGLLATMIEPTNVEGILKVDINQNDYYVEEAKERPLYLLFNPHEDQKVVEYEPQTTGCVSLYDVVSHQFLKENIKGKTDIEIKGNEAVMILEIPIEEGENQYSIDRKVEHGVSADVPLAVNILDIPRYGVIDDKYPINIDIQTTDEAAVSNIKLSLDGEPIFQNVNYTKPYELEATKLENGYHLLEVEVTAKGGLKDYSYARVFVQKDDQPYILNNQAIDITKWEYDSERDISLTNEDKDALIQGRIVSQSFAIDFSQVPLLDLEVVAFSGSWSVLLRDVESGHEFYLLKDSTDAGHIISNMNYVLHRLNPGKFNLLGKHEVQLVVLPGENSTVTLKQVQIFNEGIQTIEESKWKTSFRTEKITHWQSRFNALARLNYYKGQAVIRNLNPDGNGGMQTHYFEVDLSKHPRFKIKVDEVDELWSLLVYIEGENRGYYLQYPTDKTGTFSYNISEVLEKALPEGDLDNQVNLQFWVVCNGHYDSTVKVDYLRLDYEKNWFELTAIILLSVLSVTAICVNVNKEN